jgi:uncharacterized protein (TIGR02246 family)
MRTSIVASFAAAAVALAAGLAFMPSAAGAEGDADGVRASCGAIVIAWNAHDAKGIAAVFTEDADMVGLDGRVFTGRAEIEKAFAEDHSGVLSKAKLEVMKEPVRFPSPDVAVSDAEVVISGAVGPDGSKGEPMTLIVTNVWKKIDGKWYVFASRPHMKAPPSAK